MLKILLQYEKNRLNFKNFIFKNVNMLYKFSEFDGNLRPSLISVERERSCVAIDNTYKTIDHFKLRIPLGSNKSFVALIPEKLMENPTEKEVVKWFESEIDYTVSCLKEHRFVKNVENMISTFNNNFNNEQKEQFIELLTKFNNDGVKLDEFIRKMKQPLKRYNSQIY